MDTSHEHCAGAITVLAGTPDIESMSVGLAGVLAAQRSLPQVQDISIHPCGSSRRLVPISSRCPQRATEMPYQASPPDRDATSPHGQHRSNWHPLRRQSVLIQAGADLADTAPRADHPVQRARRTRASYQGYPPCGVRAPTPSSRWPQTLGCTPPDMQGLSRVGLRPAPDMPSRHSHNPGSVQCHRPQTRSGNQSTANPRPQRGN
jgi:hypothetical protein